MGTAVGATPVRGNTFLAEEFDVSLTATLVKMTSLNHFPMVFFWNALERFDIELAGRRAADNRTPKQPGIQDEAHPTHKATDQTQSGLGR